MESITSSNYLLRSELCQAHTCYGLQCVIAKLAFLIADRKLMREKLNRIYKTFDARL